MEFSSSSALGALAVALSAARAVVQLANVTHQHKDAPWWPGSGALLGSAYGAAVIGYSYTVGGGLLLLMATVISASSFTAAWLIPIAVRLVAATPCVTDPAGSSSDKRER